MYPHTIENGAGERLGTLLGRYRKYANAPEPVRRGFPLR